MKRLTVQTENKLEEAVRREINRQADGYTVEGVLNDLMQGGCQSGMMGSLIYYADTVKFYRKHKADIKALLLEALDDTGSTPAELFGDKWDKEDVFAEDQYNQNLLAWFGFEETARILAYRAGIEI